MEISTTTLRKKEGAWGLFSVTNTYQDDADPKEKITEELRCIRCALERLIRILDEGLFVDYEHEKFFGKKKDDAS